MYDDFIKEHEKTREAFKAQQRAEDERLRAELDARFGTIADAIDITREEQGRGFRGVTSDMNNSRQTTREMLIRLDKLGRELDDIQFDTRANTLGLLHVLAELRREIGEEPPGA